MRDSEFMADGNPPTFHRDLKDTNVIMRPGFGVVLIDYGTSKEIDTGDSVSLSLGAGSQGWMPAERV